MALLSDSSSVNYIIQQLWTGVFIVLAISPLYVFNPLLALQPYNSDLDTGLAIIVHLRAF